MMKLLRDTSAQVVPLSYLMSFVISMIVLTTVVLSYQGMVDGTARFGYADVGNDIAGTIVDMRLAVSVSGNGTVTRVIDIPPSIGGRSYNIKTDETIVAPGTTTQAIRISAGGTTIYVPLGNIEHGTIVMGEASSGAGQVVVKYDITNRTITLR